MQHSVPITRDGVRDALQRLVKVLSISLTAEGCINGTMETWDRCATCRLEFKGQIVEVYSLDEVKLSGASINWILPHEFSQCGRFGVMKVILLMEDQENSPSHKGYVNKLQSLKFEGSVWMHG